MKIAHVALWTRNLAAQQAFWCETFGGVSNALYVSKNRPGFQSYFIELDDGPTLELMTIPELHCGQHAEELTGWAHIAVSVGTEQDVERLAERAAQKGRLHSPPRRTGDGYYEAIIRDPDGNLIELVAED